MTSWLNHFIHRNQIPVGIIDATLVSKANQHENMNINRYGKWPLLLSGNQIDIFYFNEKRHKSFCEWTANFMKAKRVLERCCKHWISPWHLFLSYLQKAGHCITQGLFEGNFVTCSHINIHRWKDCACKKLCSIFQRKCKPILELLNIGSFYFIWQNLSFFALTYQTLQKTGSSSSL